jgi:hypothetical protein
MAVPDHVITGQYDHPPLADGVLSAAQASSASTGTEALGAQRAGISQVRDKPQTTAVPSVSRPARLGTHSADTAPGD